MHQETSLAFHFGRQLKKHEMLIKKQKLQTDVVFLNFMIQAPF